MAQSARTVRLAALFTVVACALIASPVVAQEKETAAPPPAAVRPTLDEADRLEKDGKPLEAIAVLEKRLADLPKDALAAERQALSLSLADRYATQAAKAAQARRSDEAITWYEKALALHRPFNTAATALDLKLLGNIYNDHLSQYTKSLEYYNQALPLFRQTGNKLQEAGTLFNVGLAYNRMPQYQKALDAYNQALAIYKQLNDKAGEADTLQSAGFIYGNLSQFGKALEYLNQAAAIYKELGKKQDEASTLNMIGFVYTALSQHAKALEFYNQVLPIARQVGNKPDEAMVLNNIGFSYAGLSQYSKALEFYNQALPLFRQVGNLQREANTLNNIGEVYGTLSQYDKALEFYNQSLTIYKRLGNKQGEAIVLYNVGFLSRWRSEYDKALEFLNQALPLFRQVGNRQREADTLNAIGLVYQSLSQYTRALDFYNQALGIRQSTGKKQKEADTLNNIGSVYVALSEYARGLEFYNQSLVIYRQLGDKAGEASELNNIGIVYCEFSQYTRALEYFNQALPLFRQVGDKQYEANALTNIGAVYYALSRNDKALEFYNQSLPLFRQLGDRVGEANTLNQTGNAYLSLSQYDRALEFYNQTLTIYRQMGNKPGEAKVLGNIGFISRLRSEYGKTPSFYNQALSIFRQIGDRQGEADTLNQLMHLYDMTQNPARNLSLAIWYGKQAVNAYQTIRGNIRTLGRDLQQSYTDSIESIYRHLADLLISQGRLAEAQQVLDLLKQQEYFTFVRRAPAETDAVNGTANLTPTEAEAEKKYREISDRAIKVAAEYETLLKKKPRTEAEEKRLDELFKELTEANAAFQAFLIGLDKEFAENKAVANRLDTVKDAEALTTTLKRLDTDTGQKTVAVYTLVGEKSLRFLVITGGVQVARTANIGAADLARKVFAFRAALKNPRLDPRPLGKELYDLVVKPIEKDLAGANAATILWSLDGVLRYIPLSALSPDGKTYLAERDIRHSLFTPATLSRLVNAPKADWKALAVGVSKPYDVEGIHFNALTGAEAEVNGVEKLLPGRILLNSDFSETSLVRSLRDGYPLVHIATHFYFRPGDEGRSFLLLGDGTPLLLSHLREMPATLFSGVDLLVLSACDTATGGGSSPNATGAEFESFGLLAQRKGAEAVLATLWPVADASTVLLMQEFYRIRKATPGLTKSAALRQAQLALLTGKVNATNAASPDATKGVAPSSEPGAGPDAPAYVPDPKRPYAHPYYWAGFVLIGNFR